MKRVLLVAAVVLAPTVALAQSAMIDAPHDLTIGSSGIGSTSVGATQICKFCHVPHAARTDMNGIWSREMPASNALTYVNNTTIAGTTLPATASPSSMRCFSCHDGTVALGDMTGAWADYTFADGGAVTLGMLNATTNKQVTRTNFNKNHPVGLPFPGTPAYNGVTSAAVAANYKTTAAATTAGVVFYNNGTGTSGVECGSCHDVHANPTGDSVPLLRVSKADSLICVSCHNK